MSEQLTEVRHDIIRYANCWEDADILLEALELENSDRVLSIGSAGDNSFSMLVHHPELVVAVDVNEVQLNLIELKKAAFKTLTHSEFLEFLGFRKSDSRDALFEKVKTELTDELSTFWSSRSDEIQLGIITQGKFEKYFRFFRKKILPLIHSRKTVEKLLSVKSPEEQRTFFYKKWNTWRWRMLFKLFFSKAVMGRFGRDPEFLKEVEIQVSTYILESSEKKLSSVNCQHNYLLHFIMNGFFSDDLPHYAREEHYDIIKKNIHRIEIFKGFAEDAFKKHSGFTKFNLSNIFEYMSPEMFRSVSDNIIENSAPNSIYVYWNLMVPRRISQINDQLRFSSNVSRKLSELDKGFFYSAFIVDQKK